MLSHLWQYPSLFGATFQKYTDIGCHLYSLLLTTVSTRHAQSATHAYICTLYCSPLYQQGTHNQLHAYICTLYCSPLYQQGTHNQLRMLTSVLSIAHHCINKARTISCMLTSVLSIAHHCINKARTISYTCLHLYSLLLTTVSTRHAQSATHAYICTLYCSPLCQQGMHNQLCMLTKHLLE